MVDQWQSVLSRLLVACALVTAGCGGGASALCEKIQQCGGGNDADLDACVASANGAEQVAAAYDCSDQYAKYAECLETKGTCSDKKFVAECNDQEDALEACQEAASVNK